MGQRVHNLTKWQEIAEGSACRFEKDKRRTVVIEVNCPYETQFYVVQERSRVEEDAELRTDRDAGRNGVVRFETGSVSEDGEVRLESSREEIVAFLGMAHGRDSFEFGVSGAFSLVPVGGPAYVYTADGLQVRTEVVAPMIFTKIANRRQRNPHLELIEYQMRLNQERMQSALEAEIERRVGAVERNLESYARQRDPRAAIERLREKEREARERENERSQQDDGTEGVGSPEPPADESGSGEPVPGKRRKVTAPSVSE